MYFLSHCSVQTLQQLVSIRLLWLYSNWNNCSHMYSVLSIQHFTKNTRQTHITHKIAQRVNI